MEFGIKNNKLIFNKIREFLKKHFPDNYKESKEYDECYHIVIESKEKEDLSIWFEFDIGKSELIVGYGFSHKHYGKRYDLEISKGLNQFLDILTSKKRRIYFYKGKTNFKNIYEIEDINGAYRNFGTSSMIFLYPFWKKTTKRITEQCELIKDVNTLIEIDKIRELIKTHANTS
ncbi:MAG: hypothetical protein R3342_13125 [Lutibacter sp.]|uniref:hypothetical protein n=1 Tax=Lutibacter sp. TaxID=1925666 RepID=UPI00299F0991|nr:hypothetical protein [Lutibacter sp.]MDX1830475.1 hypothetical protein [Lutibacter sp.]